MEVVFLVIRLVLAGVFLTAGIGKLLDREGSEKALQGFEVPGWSVKPVAAVLPVFEILIAFGLLFTVTSWYSALAGLGMLAVFTAAMLYQISKGNAPDCHCFGQIHSEPVSTKSVVRNVVFAVPAVVLLISGRTAQGTEIYSGDAGRDGVYMFQLIAAVTVLAFLLAIVFLLKRISDLQSQIIRRIEILEILSSEGKEVTREGMTDPQAGLPLGSPLPHFTVTASDGLDVDSSNLTTPGKPALLVFVSPSCHPCEALAPELDRWAEEYGDQLDFILLSGGTIEENLAKFGDRHSERLYVQQDRDVLDQLGAIWTPAAILLDRSGAIASRNAIGDTAIRELVEGIVSSGLENEYVFFANGDSDKLLIGSEVPDFTLVDLDGEEYNRASFSGQRTLAAFWSTTCPFCVNMIEDLKAWNSSKGERDPQLIVFSDGDPEQHKALELDAPILLEKDYTTAAKIGMNGTPSAVLIDDKGRIVSETGVGAAMIWALLGMKNGYPAEGANSEERSNGTN